MGVGNQSFKELPKALAVLHAESGNPSYIDKIAHAPSRDIGLLYIQEALRDLQTLRSVRKERFNVKSAYDELQTILWSNLEKEIEAVRNLKEGRELREALSFIGAKALTITAKIGYWEKRTQSEEPKEGENPA